MPIDYESFQALKQEIEEIGREMRSAPTPTPEAKTAIGLRISKSLDRFEDLLKSEAYQVMAKDAPESETEAPVEAETPSEVLVKRGGFPGTCTDCGLDECVCFSHLPRPKITVRPGPEALVKVSFPVEFTPTDKVAWLHAMKMAIAKRKGK